MSGAANETPGETPDEVLVVAAILGDLQAFDDLTMRYRAAVVRLAEHLAGEAEAQDVAQDALLLAFRALPSIDEPAKFAAWLMAITRNCALRVRTRASRREAWRVDLDDYLLERLGVFTLPYDTLRDDQEHVRRALALLPESYAGVLRLRFLDEMPLRRIAGFLDLPMSTVKWRIHKGRALLKRALNRLDPSFDDD